MRNATQPVSRPRVLLGALIGLAVLSGLIAVVDGLRHPLPENFEPDISLAEDDSDPRLPTVCDESIPREGQRRTTDQDGATDPAAVTGEETPGQDSGPSAGDPGGTGGAAAEEAEEVGGSTGAAIASAPVEVNSSLLYDCPQVYDGARVRYTGEVIGAVLDRDDGAWVQLNDDVYANLHGPLPAHRDYRGGNAGIGVHIPTQLAAQIEWVGGPNTWGDRLAITGTFQRVDPATAEVAIIRAEEGSIVERGELLDQPSLPDRRRLALLAAIVAAVVTTTERVLARRR